MPASHIPTAVRAELQKHFEVTAYCTQATLSGEQVALQCVGDCVGCVLYNLIAMEVIVTDGLQNSSVVKQFSN